MDFVLIFFITGMNVSINELSRNEVRGKSLEAM